MNNYDFQHFEGKNRALPRDKAKRYKKRKGYNIIIKLKTNFDRIKENTTKRYKANYGHMSKKKT